MPVFREGDIVRCKESGVHYIIVPKFPNAPVRVKDGASAVLRALNVAGNGIDRRKKPLLTKLDDSAFRVICNSSEQYRAYLRGLKDGFVHTAKRGGHFDHEKEWIRLAYLSGYNDGGILMSKTINAYCEENGYWPSILRG